MAGRRTYATEPIVRAFEHHATTCPASQFEFKGVIPDDDPRKVKFLVVLRDENVQLSAREAWLVCQAFNAGRASEAHLTYGAHQAG